METLGTLGNWHSIQGYSKLIRPHHILNPKIYFKRKRLVESERMKRSVAVFKYDIVKHFIVQLTMKRFKRLCTFRAEKTDLARDLFQIFAVS